MESIPHSHQQPGYGQYDLLTMFHEPGIPPHELRLKESAVCTLMRNLSVEEGLVKNARVIIRGMLEKVIKVELIPNAEHLPSGRCFLLPRIVFEFQPKFCNWTVQRRQFPLRLAYATTFNSCQGLTLDRTVVDLRTPVFAHGQLYTSLSRVRHRSCIQAFFSSEATAEDPITKNIVYKRLLLSQ